MNDRYRLQEWLNFIGTELHKSFSPLFNKASSDDVKNTAKTSINKRLGYLNDQLASRQYLMGGNFTVADAYAFTIVNWTNFVGIDLKPYPNVGAYMGRVATRPKVQETLKAEGLVKRTYGSPTGGSLPPAELSGGSVPVKAGTSGSCVDYVRNIHEKLCFSGLWMPTSKSF